MGMRGPKPQSAKVRLLHARTLKTAAPLGVFDPKPYKSLPQPPSFLSANALAYWRQLGADLIRNGLLTPLDKNAFAVLCQKLGRMQECEANIDAAEARGDAKASLAWRRIANATSKQCQQLSGEFGLSPAQRSRVREEGLPKPAPSPWSTFDKPDPAA